MEKPMALTLENPLLEREFVVTRVADTGTKSADTQKCLQIVSTDGHWEVVEDIWYGNFPNNMKEKAPRVVRRFLAAGLSEFRIAV
jgi:hypothetical protein